MHGCVVWSCNYSFVFLSFSSISSFLGNSDHHHHSSASLPPLLKQESPMSCMLLNSDPLLSSPGSRVMSEEEITKERLIQGAAAKNLKSSKSEYLNFEANAHAIDCGQKV